MLGYDDSTLLAELHRDRIKIENALSSLLKSHSDSIANDIEFNNLKHKLVQLNIKEDELRSALAQQELTDVMLQNRKAFIGIDRLIVGDGLAGTMLYDELPVKYREKSLDGIPNVLVISDPSHKQQWIKHKEQLLGQGEHLNAPPVLAYMPSEFSIVEENRNDPITNPFGYVRGTDMARAMRATQNDMGMKTLPSELTKIEKREKCQDWPDEAKGYPYRVTLNIDGQEKIVYTNHVDLCTGFGKARRLMSNQSDPSRDQIDAALNEKLEKEKKMIYAGDEGKPELHGDVLMFGGGAMGAAICYDYLYENPEKHKGTKITWLTREVFDLNDTRDTNRQNKKLLDEDIEQTADILLLGGLKKVEMNEKNGKIKVTLTQYQAADKDWADRAKNITKDIESEKHYQVLKRKSRVIEKETTIEVDQIVVAMGSDNKLNKIFEDVFSEKVLDPKDPSKVLKSNLMVEGYYSKSVKGHDKVPVGTRSLDGCIVAWGATGRAGFGLPWGSDERKAFSAAIKPYVETLPGESRGESTVLSATHAIRTQAKALRAEGLLPKLDREKRAKNINNVTALELTKHIFRILENQNPNHDDPNHDKNPLKAFLIADHLIELRKSPQGIASKKDLVSAGFDKALVDDLCNRYRIEVPQSPFLQRRTPLLSSGQTKPPASPEAKPVESPQPQGSPKKSGKWRT